VNPNMHAPTSFCNLRSSRSRMACSPSPWHPSYDGSIQLIAVPVLELLPGPASQQEEPQPELQLSQGALLYTGLGEGEGLPKHCISRCSLHQYAVVQQWALPVHALEQ
jgi:hypothetical protein